jgi:signal peptidase I
MLKKLGTFFLDIVEVVVLAVGIFLIVYLLILRPHKIKGASMSPNFPDGEYLLTEKISYYLNDPKRGDVVVFKPPVSEDEYIKRVIGMPGDKVSIRSGYIYLNGKMLEEDYIDESVITSGGAFLADNQEYIVPEGMYFVVGDNRPHSSDSRAWGPVTKQVMTGRAWVIYWPPKLAGKVPAPAY